MAEQFEEVIRSRISALEARVEAESKSVKEHFAELQQFITFNLTRQSEALRAEWRVEFRRIDERLHAVDGRLDGVEERLEKVDRKMDAYHEATKQILHDILRRLPG